MADRHFSLSCLFSAFVLYIAVQPNQLHARRPADLLHRSSSELTGSSTQKSYGHAVAGSKSMPEKDAGVAAGVVRATPARPMPSYDRHAAPVPLPEFPSLGPPVVWSFPAAPLPAIAGPPPELDLPALPKTGDEPASAPSPCHGGDLARRPRLPGSPPSSPFIAAEPAVTPGPLHAPEIAPQPTAGGPSAPPY